MKKKSTPLFFLLSLLSILIFLISFVGFSQSQSDDLKLPQVIPPSPNTASLGKYGEIPIGLFTGSPQINISLCKVETRNLSVPITLRYSSNGIRVDEYASNVGLGWDLNAGGVITRRVNDDPDEHTQINMPDISQLYTTEMENFLIFQSGDNGNDDSNDYQPDVFSFNFNGYSGRFYLDTNSNIIMDRTPILFEPSPLKIEILSYLSSSTADFKITDPNGIIYYFGGSNAVDKSMSRSTCAVIPPNTDLSYKIPDAWHLSKISHPNGDVINFIYETKSINYDNGISQSVTRKSALNSGTCPPATSDSPCLSQSTNISAYLKEINAVGFGKVTFSYSHKTGDMPDNMDKLDTISVYDKNNVLLKEHVFEYQMYAATGSGNPLIPAELIQDYHSERFFLKKVTEKSKTGTLKPAHEFEYYDPGSLPTRFSGSQDYWGYYNGKSNENLIDLKTFQSVAGNGVLMNNLSPFSPANRDPNSYFGIKGILKKVTYPTGGFNTLYYDPHSYLGSELVLPPVTQQIATVYSIDDNPTVYDEFTTSTITFNQDADIDFIVDMNEVFGDMDLSGETTDPLTFSVEVTDVTTNGFASIYERVDSFTLPVLRANPFTVTVDNFTKDYFVRLESNHSYKVRVAVSRGDTRGTSKLYYYATNGTTTNINVEVGGLRIAKVETSDGAGNIQTKNYYYGTLDNLTESSGKVVNRNSDPTITRNELLSNPPPLNEGNVVLTLVSCKTTTLFSNSAYPIYGTYHIAYNSVIEEYGTNFSGGGVKNIFNTNYLGVSLNLALGDYIPGTPLSNFFGFGQVLERSVFKKTGGQYKILNSSENFYKDDPQLYNEIEAYNIRERVRFEPLTAHTFNIVAQVNRFDITTFHMKQEWHYLEKTINTQYDQDGLNPVVTTTSYFYDNPDHLQVTRTKTTVSDDEPIITKFYYPDDVIDEFSLGLDDLSTSVELAISKLKTLNRIAEPVQVESYKDLDNDGIGDANELLTARRTNYKEWYTNKVWPENIQTLKGIYSSSTNTLEDRLTFHSNYSNGNVKEVSKTNGARIVYVWGYNELYPIAKIENATYSQVSSQVSNLQTKSDADDDRTIGTLGNEGLLRTALDALRSSLPNAMVTTYTYDPLIGVTSMTDPRGNTVYYEYDDFNRLKHVKDLNGNLLSENKYHYTN